VLLNDPQPAVRRWTAEAFVELAAKPDLRAVVLEECTATLAGDQWRALEQAAIVSAHLQHESAAGRLLQLMAHPRPEASIAACFALRKLQLPDTFPMMLEFAEQQHERVTTSDVTQLEITLINDRLGQLIQAFGVARYLAAEPLLRKFIPKHGRLTQPSRAAACWSIGHFHEGAAPTDLTNQFTERLSDTDSNVPEYEEVRRTCAASLGRMKSTTAVPALQKYAKAEGQFTDVGQVCWWALEQITGNASPPFIEVTHLVQDWFLQPVK
jgi:HEAT repeat protein